VSRYGPAGELCLFPLQPGVQQRIPRRIHQRRMAPQTVVIRIVLPLMLPLASRARMPQNSQHVHVARHQVPSRRRILIAPAVGFIPTPRPTASVIVVVIRPAVPLLVVAPGIVVVLPAVVLPVVLIRAAAPIVALLEVVVLVMVLLLLVMSAWLVSLLARSVHVSVAVERAVQCIVVTPERTSF
jgi:hypothetical protein